MAFSIPKGTKDVLPSEAYKWHYTEGIAREVASLFNAKEIRTPVFEHTELFLRGVGDTTDIVNKEMYTFIDKGNRSITLKPEGTAGVARSFVENSLYAGTLPLKTYYISPVFRYERPQSGRLREHHQFGVEFFGSPAPEMDAEVISLAKTVFDRLGLKNLRLYINSIGCPECRARYNEALKAYFSGHISEMCATCKERIDKNPLRMLDCKEARCSEIAAEAPLITDYLCDDCRTHMQGVEQALSAQGIEYEINPKIVRGLDYYTRTVFEFVSEDIGAKGTVCGGGRYDNLVSDVGGKPCPAVGFGMGLERLMLTLEAAELMPEDSENVTLFLGYMGEENKLTALSIVAKLRAQGVSAETEFNGRSVKAQMKYADKINAKYTAILGSEEAARGFITLKNMSTGEGTEVSIAEIDAFF